MHIFLVDQSAQMASPHLTEEAVYLCTGNPMPKDIEQIAYWLLNESFSTSHQCIHNLSKLKFNFLSSTYWVAFKGHLLIVIPFLVSWREFIFIIKVHLLHLLPTDCFYLDQLCHRYNANENAQGTGISGCCQRAPTVSTQFPSSE